MAMHPARLLLLLLLAVAAVSGATADDDDPWVVSNSTTCSAAGNYTDSSPFGKNVAELLSALSSPPPPATAGNYWWFRSHTVGQVSGLAMCYADADEERCLDCLNSANSISDLCDHSRNVGYLSSVGCAIRYADEPFLGTATDSDTILRLGFRAASDDAAGTREARRGLLTQLAERASGDALRFAAGSQGYKKQDAVNGSVWQVMYGMAQCTRDLPPAECSSCLMDHLGVMDSDVSVNNSTYASVMGFSCYLMYQMNKPINFIAGMEAAPPPTGPPSPTGSSAASPPAPPIGPKTMVIAALAAAAVMLFSVGA